MLSYFYFPPVIVSFPIQCCEKEKAKLQVGILLSSLVQFENVPGAWLVNDAFARTVWMPYACDTCSCTNCIQHDAATKYMAQV